VSCKDSIEYIVRICRLFSLNNALHYTAIADLADTQNIDDVFALTETWISPNTTSAQLFDAIPHGFTFISTPRLVSDSYTSIVGGGTSFLLCVPCKLLSSPITTFKSYELSIYQSINL